MDVPEGVDDEEREQRRSKEPTPGGSSGDGVMYVETKSKVPRGLKISKGDVDNQKGSGGCP
eukprot:5331461-Karenia_brevis.AAC.1